MHSKVSLFLSTRRDPNLDILYDVVEEDRWRGGLVPKNPRVSLIPNAPSYKHHERGHGRSKHVTRTGHPCPPIYERLL